MGKPTGRPPGFNASSHGFTTAPPVIPDVPTPMGDGWEDVALPFDGEPMEPSMDEVTAAFKQLVPVEEDEYEGLSPEEIEKIKGFQTSAPPVEQVLSGPGPRQVTLVLTKAWGHEKETAEQVRADVQERMSTEDLPEGYLSPQKAASELRMMLDSSPFPVNTGKEFDTLLSRVETGSILLSEGDMIALRSFQTALFDKQERDNALEVIQPLDGEWIPAAVQRRCTLCGKFVGARMEHVGDAECAGGDKAKAVKESLANAVKQKTQVLKKVADFAMLDLAGPDYYRDRVKESILSADELMDGNAEEVYPEMVLGRVPRYSDDEIEDIYASMRDYRQLLVLSMGTQSRRIGGTRQYNLPRRVRAAFVENPTGNRYSYDTDEMSPLLTLLAARIEPPLSDFEVKHIMDVGGPAAINALLNVKRTRRDALNILTSYPSVAGYALAYVGTLNEATLEAMANSADPKVRLQAAVGFNTSVATRQYLAEDHDESVREALISPPYSDRVKYGEGEAVEYPEHEKAWRDAAAYSSGVYMSTHLMSDSFDRYDYDYGSPRNHKIWYQSALHQNIELGDILINDSSERIAGLTFQAFPRQPQRDAGAFSAEQRYLISKITSRRRFNEMKRLILADPEKYPADDPDVARFLAR